MFGRKTDQHQTLDSLSKELQECQAKRDFFEDTTRVLLYYIKEFSFDLSEINAEEFKERIDKLSKSVLTETSVARLGRTFEGGKRDIAEFASREKNYLAERENELKGIVEFLRSSVVDVIGDSRDFSVRMYESNLRMEEFTKLGDIRKIKEGLKQEVDQVRDVIRRKQQKDAMTMQALSNEVSALKSNLEKIRDVSVTDALTGAYNRLGFDSEIWRYLEASHVSRQPLSVLMCDIDDFKDINDKHGHLAGDLILKVFVQECRRFFRSDDMIARYGGEEFVIAIPGVGIRTALRRARDICRDLSSKEFLIDNPKFSGKIGFTVSVGVSEARPHETPEELIARADEALYRAKRSGKNRAESL